MEWYLEGCGGKLTAPEGLLNIPNDQQRNDNDLMCIWEIVLEYGQKIEITIVDIGFETSKNCTDVSIAYAYERDFKNPIGKFCSVRDKNHVTTTRGHQLFVKFEAHQNDHNRDLKITYKSVETNCGGSFFGSEGVISSPNYPLKNYENNQTCEWFLKTDESHTILLTFFDFMLETSDNCTKDFVEVIDPLFNKILWKSCGTQFPNQSVIQSQRNEMVVRLVTDNENNSKGFEAQYTTSCGSLISTSSSGKVHYQRDHRSKEDKCLWTITSEDLTKKIVLTFTHIMIPHDKCNSKIEVFEGFTDTGPLKASFCDLKTPPAFYSYGNALTVKLNFSRDFDSSEIEFYYSVLDNRK